MLIATQIKAYRTGSLEMARDLKQNSSTRLTHDATKLMSTLREQQRFVMEAKVQLEGMSLPSTRSNQDLGRFEKDKQNLLATLESVQH